MIRKGERKLRILGQLLCGKKGLGISQVFMFIVAALTFSVIMIFGFKAITGFLSDAQKVEFVQFKVDLETAIKNIYTDYGAVRREQFNPPATFTRICFIDLDYSPTKLEIDELCTFDPIACTVWENSEGYDSGEENVFLTPPAEVRIKVNRVSANGGYLCENIQNGVFSLILEGKGDRTEISRITDEI